MSADAAAKSDDLQKWNACMQQLSGFDNVYMKLSGAFSELSDDRVSVHAPEQIVTSIKPWLDSIFTNFGSERIMFGSDWPVCNVRGPATEESWSVWTNTVRIALDSLQLSEEQKARIWHGTASEAYRLP